VRVSGFASSRRGMVAGGIGLCRKVVRKLDARSFAFDYPCTVDVWGANAMSKSIAIAVAYCLAALVATDKVAFAQAGSTGGTIGKTDKSVSGGEEATPSYRRARPGSLVSRPSQEPGSAVASISGKWIWSAKCADDVNWNGTFDFDQKADGTVGGSCTGTPSACHSVSGHIVANRLTLTIGWDYSTGTLDLTVGNRGMAGSENSRWHGRCTYSARRF
jgi:hypothetical protein